MGRGERELGSKRDPKLPPASNAHVLRRETHGHRKRKGLAFGPEERGVYTATRRCATLLAWTSRGGLGPSSFNDDPK